MPETVSFATKPAMAATMAKRAIAADVPFAWVAADSVYGVSDLEMTLRRAGKGYVLGVNANHWFGSRSTELSVAGAAKDIAENLPRRPRHPRRWPTSRCTRGGFHHRRKRRSCQRRGSIGRSRERRFEKRFPSVYRVRGVMAGWQGAGLRRAVRRSGDRNSLVAATVALLALIFDVRLVAAQDSSPPGNADYVKATVELVYQCKLVADEAFIRRSGSPESGAAASYPVARCGGAEPLFPGDGGGKSEISCEKMATQLAPRVAGSTVTAFERRCRRMRQASRRPNEDFRQTVFKLYANAYLTLQDVVEEQLEGPARQRFALLAKDIEFRTELLSIGEDFWGGTITSVPSIPPVHLAAMTSLLGQLEQLAKEIREIEGRLDDKALKAAEISAQAAGTEGEIKASLPNSDRIDLLRRQAEQRVATATAQVRLVQARQKQIEGEQARLSAQIDALSADINKSLVSAIGNYLGVPPEVAKVANGGSVEETFKSYVGGQASALLADPEIIASFGGIGESAALYVQRVQEVKREVESYVEKAEGIRDTVVKTKEYVEDFKAVIRQPTVENLTRIGVKVMDKLEPNQARELRQGFCRIIDQQKPIGALLEQAREPGQLSDKIRGGIVEGLRQLPDFNVRATGYLRAAIAEVSPARQVAWIRDLLQRSGEVALPHPDADQLRTELVRALAALWPRSLIAKIPDGHRAELMKELQKRFGIGSEEEFVDRIEEVALPRLTVRLNRIALTLGDNVYPVAEWTEIDQLLRRVEAFEVETAKVQARLEAALATITNSAALKEKIAREVFKQIPFGALETEVENLANKAEQAKKVWDGALAGIGENIGANCGTVAEKGTAVGNLVAMQIGARMAVDIGEAREAAVRHDAAAAPTAAGPVPPSATGGGGAGGGEGAMEREIALQALNAAFPPAGAVAGLGIKVFQGMQETRELGRKMRELTEESIRLTRTEIQLLATIDATRVAIEVNRLDGELSEIRRAAALAQYDILTRAGQMAGAQTLAGLAQIQRRQPLVFYLAERLRQEYDLLDRSIALWGPQGGTVRDAIRRLVEDDPQNIRLALDTDIHLFQWLDRSEERVRTDIDRVLTHWRQLHRLVSDVCDRVGCLPGQSRLGQVQQTAMVDVCTLMASSDCRRLRAWLSQEAGVERRGEAPFVAEFGFSPDDGHFPANLLNVRVVDFRLGAFARREAAQGSPSEPLLLNSIQLLHPGVAFIRQPQGYVREAMAPSETTSFDWPRPFDLDALGTRWNAAARSSRRHFEGYGLVTSWRLVATRSPSLARIDRDAQGSEVTSAEKGLRSGIFVRVAYSYYLPPVSSEADAAFVARADSPYIRNQMKRAVVQIAGRARQDLRTIEVPESMLQLIGDAQAYAAAQAAWLDGDRKEDEASSLDCDRPAGKAAVTGFATRVCLAPLDAQQQQALVREEAKALVRSCSGAEGMVLRSTPTLRRREVDHIVASRYGPAYEVAKKLVTGALGAGAPSPENFCGQAITTTFELCKALRTCRL